LAVLLQYDLFNKIEDKTIIRDFLAKYTDVLVSTPRALVIYIGTEVLRKIKDDVHCEALKDYINTHSDNVDVFVISDCRFVNELDYFKDSAVFLPYFIHRPKAYDNFIRELDVGKSHISEIEVLKLIPKCQIIINNNDIESFSREIREKVLL
jgi:hypothetical protein